MTKDKIEFDDEMFIKRTEIYEKIVKGKYKPESGIKKLFEVNDGYKTSEYLAEDFKEFFIWYYTDETSNAKISLSKHHMKSLDSFQKYIDKLIKLKDKLELFYQIYDQIYNYKI